MKRKIKKPIRIIPVLDIKNGVLIKGINLEGLRVLGIPRNFANYYYPFVKILRGFRVISTPDAHFFGYE